MNIRYILDGQALNFNPERDGEVTVPYLARIVDEINHDLAEKYPAADVDVSIGWGVLHTLFIDGQICDDDYQQGPGAVIDKVLLKGRWKA